MVSLLTNFSIFLQSYANPIKTTQLLLNFYLLSYEYYYYE